MKRKLLLVCMLSLQVFFSNAQWEQTNGPERGRVNNIFADGSRLYISTDCGVYFSDDKGDTWHSAHTGLTLYNACGGMDKMGDTLIVQNTFLKFSTDSGTTWQTFASNPPASPIQHILVNDTSIFACGYFGIYRTDDFGQTWNNLTSLFLANTHFTALLKVGNTVFLGTNSNLWKSIDNGDSWTSVLTQQIQQLELYNGRVFIGTGSDLISPDTCVTFSAISPPGIDFGKYIANDSIVYGVYGTKGVHLSLDLGVTWTAADSNLFDTASLDIGIMDTTVFTANGRGGMFSTTAGDSVWTEKNYRLPLSQILVLSSYKNKLLAYTYEQNMDMLRSTDNGNTWSSVKGNLPANIAVNTILIEDSAYFITSPNYGAFKSTDYGVTWNAINNGLTSTNTDDIVRKGNRLFISQGTGGAVFISDDEGVTWTLSSTGFQYPFAANFFVDGSRIYVKSAYNIYYSDNDGASWDSIIRAGCPSGAGPDVINRLDNKLLALFHSDGIFMFDSTVGFWTEITTQFGNDNCQDFLLVDSIIVLANATGIFISNNLGNTWTPMNSLSAYDITAGDSVLFAGSNGGGVWRLNKSYLVNLPTLSGTFYYDTNSNGIHDAGEPGAANMIMHIQPVNQYATSNGAGNYSYIYSNFTSTYDLIPFIPNYYTLTSSPAFYTVNTNGSSIDSLDFGIHAIPGVTDVSAQVTSPRNRKGFHSPYWITFRNSGTDTISNELRFYHNGILDYTISYPPPDVINGDTLVYNYQNLLPQEERIILADMLVPISAPANSVIHACVEISPIATDTFPQDNVYCIVRAVFEPRDPNHKDVYPDSVIAGNELLNYTIHFQNTGNDTAINVIVVDTLDANVDISTFEFLGSSHLSTWTIAGNGILTFSFSNIYLPDSNVNEFASHGFVMYRMSLKPNLPSGTVIQNFADIYFDFNAAVRTDTTFNITGTVGISEPEKENKILIYPNPVNSELTVLSSGDIIEIEIFDVIGKEIYRTHIKHLTSGYKLQTSNFTNGIYLIKLKTENKLLMQKFIVQH